MTKEMIEFKTHGTCCALMHVEVENDIISDVKFFGGCDGNLKGIRKLVTGMKIDDVIEKLQGIPCRDKSTSCPDQLAQCLIQYKSGQPVA